MSGDHRQYSFGVTPGKLSLNKSNNLQAENSASQFTFEQFEKDGSASMRHTPARNNIIEDPEDNISPPSWISLAHLRNKIDDSASI